MDKTLPLTTEEPMSQSELRLLDLVQDLQKKLAEAQSGSRDATRMDFLENLYSTTSEEWWATEFMPVVAENGFRPAIDSFEAFEILRVSP
jgi:hypothetical protein